MLAYPRTMPGIASAGVGAPFEMIVKEPELLSRALSSLQSLALIVLAAMSGLAIGFTLLAALGFAPWLEMQMSIAGTPVPHAGAVTQIVLTLLLLTLMAFLPASHRVMALENSHRDFKLAIEDIARAYRACHEADRAGVFQLESEFDALARTLCLPAGPPRLPPAGNRNPRDRRRDERGKPRPGRGVLGRHRDARP